MVYYDKDPIIAALNSPVARNDLDNNMRTVRQLEAVEKLSPNTAAGLRPASDPSQTINPHQTDLGNTSKVEYGMITDIATGARCYKILPEDGGMPLACSLATHSPVTPVGVYEADTLVIGSQVRFIRHPGTHTGMILCTEPNYAYDARRFYGDFVSFGSNTGVHVEEGLKHPLSLGGSQEETKLNGGIIDYSGRSPVDSLEIGEMHKSTETGITLHMDSYMGYMRIDEMCGVWLFYWDSMLRLTGQNFEEWAAHSQREAYDDEGESAYYHGIAPYPWESMGQLINPDLNTWTELTADDVQNSTPYYARVEPLHDDLQPFHRFRTYAGYLGQGQKKLMCAPDLSGTPPAELLYSDTTYSAVGLHEQNITMSGHWAVRSALGMTIAKRPKIPVPKRNNLVQSENGDTSADYRASDYFGTGDPHLVQPTPNADIVTVTGVAGSIPWHMASAVLDLHAHLFNWQASHPFHYHKKDYLLEEEQSYAHVDANSFVPTWGELNSDTTWYLDIPNYDIITIDHRDYMTADVYNSTSYLTFLDEGGIVLGDGWGSEIRMAGGCIHLECSGDVFCNAGRNVISWGGRDVILRAHESVDVTANKRDVRLKADENIQIIAGNNPDAYGGHVLIESRSPGPPSYDWSTTGEQIEANGIVLRAMNTEIVGWAESMYFRTGVPSGKSTSGTPAAAVTKAGDITFDAFGIGDIITRSNFVKHFVHCAVAHVFPDDGSASDNVNFFTVDGSTLCGDTYTDGDVVSFGSHVAGDDFLSCGGHFYSSTGGTVKKLTGASVTTVCDAVSAGAAYEVSLRAWGTSAWAADLGSMWYATGRPGNEDVIKSAWGSLRVEQDYKSGGWFLFEPKWAQTERVYGADAAATWTESEVETNITGSPGYTYPFPGQDRWTADSTYYEQPLALNTQIGYADNRGAAYEAAMSLATPVAIIPDTRYPRVTTTKP